jgi:outer membrane lipoprotein carrier protein
MWQSILITLATLISPPIAKGPPPALDAGQVVAKVQAYYDGVAKLKADFRQEYTNNVYGRSSISDGKLYIAKPGKMRWDYAKPEKKHFISDGATLWVYEEEAAQAYTQSLANVVLPVAVTFLSGQGKLTAEFDVALDPGKYGGKADICLKLTPKQPSAQYKNLWLVVDPADFHVKESIILETSDNVNHFTFAGIKANDASKVTDKSFKFSPPKGVKVIQPPQPGTP